MKRCFVYLYLYLTLYLTNCEGTQLKVLHLSFHKGCIKEVNALAEVFNFELDTWFIPDLPAMFFDGVTKGNALYNIGHARAQRIWDLHGDTFEKYDLVITSDTAPLCRPFLQNHFQKPLIIWICNRFDYCDEASRDCLFPDLDYYQLINEAKNHKNVKIIGYTAFEHHYAKSKGVDTGSLVITPCVPSSENGLTSSSIPSHIIKNETFFLPPYHNETVFMDLSQHCKNLEISNYCGRYNGAEDLQDFKGIIHIPYSWSNLALFENIHLGLIYFIPSPDFFRQLVNTGPLFHPNLITLLQEDLFYLSEWYCPERKEIFVYFDSWVDLKQKIDTLNYAHQRDKIKRYAQDYKTEMLSRWKKVLDSLD